MEKWKTIKDTDLKYSISNHGRVRNNNTGRLLKGSHVGRTKKRQRIPYKCHGLLINGERKFFLTHRLVAENFLSKPEFKNIVNHIDENVQNNHWSNLEWVTNKENCRHSNKKRIIQSDYFTGDVIKIWDALYLIKDAGYNISRVSEVLNKKPYRKSHGGFNWRYE